MRWVRFAVLVLVITILQAGLADAIAIKNIKPDLLLILLIFCSVYHNTSEAIITSFAIGFAADIITEGSIMGPRMISFGLFGTLLSYLHRIIAIRKMPYQSLVIFITGLLTGITVVLLSLLRSEAAPQKVYSFIFTTSLYSSLIGPFLFLPLAWWMRIKTHRFSTR